MLYAKNSHVNKKVSKHFKEKAAFDNFFIPLRRNAGERGRG